MQRALLVASLLLLCPPSAFALTITVTGTSGLPGVDGQAAVASALSGDAANSATAVGGAGGPGLANGPGPGDGGAATATAGTASAGDASASAIATGGVGGAGSGSGTGGPLFSDGGAGGAATASATAESTGGGSASASVRVTGGVGGLAGVSGAGQPAGSGGAPGETTLGPVTARSAAGRASAVADVQGGVGGSSGTDALNDAAAGGSVVLTDAVDAEAPERIFLEQIARGGAGGGSRAGVSGAGGDATSDLSSARSSAWLQLETEARGGTGGRSTASGVAGDGGSATTTVVGTNDAGLLVLDALASGGAAGEVIGAGSAGRGGDADARASATTLGAGHGIDIRADDPGSGALAGAGGKISNAVGGVAGSGGDAAFVVEGTAHGDSSVFVSGLARGGEGGSILGGTGTGGAGGNASLHVEGHNGGAESVDVRAGSYAGSGGSGAGAGHSGGAGGVATVSARGTSLSGDVAVRATNANGAVGSMGISVADAPPPVTTTLVDAVSGSTAGHLTLWQTALGAGAGDAFAALEAENEGGGSLETQVTAQGGRGFDFGPAARVRGGDARLGSVRGTSSTGAAVTVSGIAHAGNGGGLFYSIPIAADGGNAELVDAVSGETSGDLVLKQEAIGGNAGSPSPEVTPLAGSGTSLLTHVTSARSVAATSWATGGAGAPRNSGSGSPGAGALGRAEVRSENLTGSSDAFVRAAGGTGGLRGAGVPGLSGGDGGAAVARAEAITHGDGDAIHVGQLAVTTPTGAYGGSGGVATGSGAESATGGTGGAATSSSTGTAFGDSTVDVLDIAQGGAGGDAVSGAPSADGGLGGSASSLAHGENLGASAVDVVARAIGGKGGLARGAGRKAGDGGTAHAEASGASSSGTVTVRAEQWGGQGGSAQDVDSAGRGADSRMIDAVTGATSGLLRLEQLAIAGAGGSLGLTGTDGGDASGALDAENTGGGDLDVFVHAEGGSGAAPWSGNGGDGGEATLGRVAGHSANGAGVRVVGQVIGGNAGNASQQGSGGDGASVILLDRVEGQTAGELALSQWAFGGRGGDSLFAPASLAGSARSELEQTASSAALSVETLAVAGNGGRLTAASGPASRGGDAAARSVAVNDSGSVAAKVNARGGRGGDGLGGAGHGAGGDAIAFASARSSGDGHDVVVGDPTPLGIERGAIGGGAAFSGGVGAAGGDAQSDAQSESQGEALGNGAVHVFDFALGGAGADDGNGGSAKSAATGSNAGSATVEVRARAIGGHGGYLQSTGGTQRGGDGGAAELGVVYGASTGGGDVYVTAEADGGAAGDGDRFTGRPGGNGASVMLDNAVDGDTQGRLFLAQIASGGRAGEEGGDHGSTSSILEVVKNAAALDVASKAYGALDAEAIAEAENAGGSVAAHGFAFGGLGRLSYTGDGERGGDAIARVRASSSGDGHAVVVTPACDGCNTATGGDGDGTYAESGSHRGGRGGEADSESVGIALGNASVLVLDRAQGGDGGFGPPISGTPGEGGIARSSALAVGAGTAAVQALASAVGGRGGSSDPYFSSSGFDGRGGDANATSTARGLGDAAALASAEGGRGRFNPTVSGAAFARALAEGASGEARAQAVASGFELASLRAIAVAPVASQVIAEARASAGDPFEHGSLGGVDVFASAAGLPQRNDVLTIGAGKAEVAGAFAEDALDVVLAIGEVGFSHTQATGGAAVTRSAELEILPDVLRVSALQDVMLGFVNPESIGPGFDSLRFRANLGDQTVVDVTFEDLAAALAWFDDRVLDLGSFTIPESRPYFFSSPLELLFDWTGSDPSAGFGVDLLVGLTPVPEPSTALLLALGLVVMAARRRRDAAV